MTKSRQLLLKATLVVIGGAVSLLLPGKGDAAALDCPTAMICVSDCGIQLSYCSGCFQGEIRVCEEGHPSCAGDYAVYCMFET
jgi:hypothetical protein